MPDTHLDAATVDCTISAVYRNTSKAANLKQIKDVLAYTDFKTTFIEGSGLNRANLVYYTRSRLQNATEYYNLDSVLQDIYGNYLNYDAVHILGIKNRETTLHRLIEVRFKDEKYHIGPQGGRIIIEPFGPGIEELVSSASFEEGQISVTSNADVTYDIIIIGSSRESSTSSGVP